MTPAALPPLHAHASPARLLRVVGSSTLVLLVLPALLTWGVYTLGQWFHGLELDGLQTVLWWAYALAGATLGGLGWVWVSGMWWVVMADCTQFIGLNGPVLTLDDAGVTYRTRKVRWGPLPWHDISRVSYHATGHLEPGALIAFALPPQHPWGMGPSKDWCGVRVNLLSPGTDDIWRVLQQRLPGAMLVGWPVPRTAA